MNELSAYDYELPPELLAKHPPPQREDARLMVVRREPRTISHHSIADLPHLLAAGDLLILNDTQVLPARLFGVRAATGGKWEGLFLSETDSGDWQIIGETRGRLQPGESISVRSAYGDPGSPELLLDLIDRDAEGVWTARPQSTRPAHELLDAFGTIPLPPYIGRKLATLEDRQRYQTTFARHPGAIAAPTAGLHLTPNLLSSCGDAGIRQAFVTLHVGIGTFRPVSTDNPDEHRMHSERCEIGDVTVDAVRTTRAAGRRVVAVGTTSVRTLETSSSGGELAAFCGETDIFIRPPWEFRSVDALLTNFHLPRSTLLMLVSALADVELIREAYRTAIEQRYRFYSYGDAMLIL